ncbi:DUF6668 family protein [Luteipulveratus mongoliensis]|uniref:DUF6668 family protein n=1 Tax=Luteipulveratus mongoliensis TaxID=571913 RepID=UPI000696B49F|nr:DUF6668 family protein [Luteipulveratus mongoliensis]
MSRSSRRTSEPANQFLAVQEAPSPSLDELDQMITDQLLGDEVREDGPAEPPHIELPPDAHVPDLVRGGQPVAERLHVVGLHGGAGATTVARWLGPVAIDAGRSLPVGTTPASVVLLVARTHGHGLDQALGAAQLWASDGLADIQLLGVLLVDDTSSDLPKPLAQQAKTVLRAFPNGWRLRWSEQWRQQPVPDVSDMNVRVRRTRTDLVKQASRAINGK